MNGREQLIPTRASLLGRLKAWSNEASWQQFFEIHWKLIYQTALQSGLNDAEAQDVVHDTVIAVCRKMPSFQFSAGTGSFRSWLFRLTQWRIVDHHRRQQHQPETVNHSIAEMGESSPGLPKAPAGAEELWDRDWEKNLMAAAIERVRLKADPLQFQIFDLFVLQNWPISRIMKTLDVHRVRIYLAKIRVGALIRKEARDLDDATPKTLNWLHWL
jgi:RNA polymerase sigma-70 factor (ECF subfamily)